MIPLSDENPTLRTPWMTYAVLAALFAVWFFVQDAGLGIGLVESVCNWGMIPGEITRRARAGDFVMLAENARCYVDAEPRNVLTPLTSMFLHGSWMHLIGNALFLWVFGNNIEDSMGRARFVVFYLLCGLVAAAAQIVVDPASPVPTVGASGAISGVLGAYLVLYPRVRVNMLFILFIFIRVIPIPAWVVLLWWFGVQLLSGLPQLNPLDPAVSSGVAYWAHIGGFATGVALVKLFENRALVDARVRMRRPLRSGRFF